ncbi:Ku protein [Paraburkholderia humisilvae]|uniref:Non-homologous end joining protein Ku n=1 Tax=Paraburkholderia humisilvae TaxID=627669 RepID=A0A6J5DPK7_9BURK|nr:Ku protein [Paraburkholderia humisilvae]CAB3754776.1 Non-homologous end joining protein Ku [Paraburkholderia humisilvae]
MAAPRSIASLTISFGLVAIPVRLFSAQESRSGVSFNMLHKDCGARVRQQLYCPAHQAVVERLDIVKGYEFEKDKYVVFSPDELKTLEETARHTIDIVSFLPQDAIDPIYFDKAYYLGPDKRGAKPYQLLAEAMTDSGTCALATWVMKGTQYVAQLRAGPEGLILQQLLYADEVRPQSALGIEKPEVQPAELQLAQQLIEQYRVAGYDPAAFKDEEKERVLAAIDQKIAGKKITLQPAAQPEGADIIDLVDALRASLKGRGPAVVRAKAEPEPIAVTAAPRQRKGPKRSTATVTPATPARKTGTRK